MQYKRNKLFGQVLVKQQFHLKRQREICAGGLPEKPVLPRYSQPQALKSHAKFLHATCRWKATTARSIQKCANLECKGVRLAFRASG